MAIPFRTALCHLRLEVHLQQCKRLPGLLLLDVLLRGLHGYCVRSRSRLRITDWSCGAEALDRTGYSEAGQPARRRRHQRTLLPRHWQYRYYPVLLLLQRSWAGIPAGESHCHRQRDGLRGEAARWRAQGLHLPVREFVIRMDRDGLAKPKIRVRHSRGQSQEELRTPVKLSYQRGSVVLAPRLPLFFIIQRTKNLPTKLKFDKISIIRKANYWIECCQRKTCPDFV